MVGLCCIRSFRTIYSCPDRELGGRELRYRVWLRRLLEENENWMAHRFPERRSRRAGPVVNSWKRMEVYEPAAFDFILSIMLFLVPLFPKTCVSRMNYSLMALCLLALPFTLLPSSATRPNFIVPVSNVSRNIC